MDKKQTVFLSAILGIGSIMMLIFLIISATKAGTTPCAVSNDLTVTGNTTLGDATTDSTTISGDLSVGDDLSFNGELKPDGSTCSNGQILKRTGADNWDCADDNTGGGGDITGVTAGTGLSGGGTSGDVTLNADTTYLQRRVSSTCAAGSSIREINSDGTVTCDGGYVQGGLYGICSDGYSSPYCRYDKSPAKCVSGHCSCESGFTSVRTGGEGDVGFFSCYKN